MIAEKNYRFCPKCAGELKRGEENCFICQRCGLYLYINPKPCCSVVIVNERGEILLVKRKREPRKGYWDLPGGFVDIEETFEESVVREIKEELQLEIHDFHYLGSYYDTYEYKGSNDDTLSCAFIAHVDNAHIVAGDDAEDATFFKPENLPFDQLAFSSMKKTLKDYLNTQTSKI